MKIYAVTLQGEKYIVEAENLRQVKAWILEIVSDVRGAKAKDVMDHMSQGGKVVSLGDN